MYELPLKMGLTFDETKNLSKMRYNTVSEIMLTKTFIKKFEVLS